MYAIYLRKSRAETGDPDALKNHRSILIALAKKMHLTVTDIYEEVVSGDSIAKRPEVQKLLKAVEQKQYKGVLVVEIERLARGDTIDQGTVARIFKYSNTKIITPIKTYDPADEFDEEYFEFSLFMSRREFTTIKRRMIRGMRQAAMDGKWIKSVPPYGYDIVRLTGGQKGYTLSPNSDAGNVRRVFEMFVDESLGYERICQRLEALGTKPYKSERWSPATIKSMLTNPVYCGLIRYGYRSQVKTVDQGVVKVSRPRSDEAELYEGLHPAIVDSELFTAANDIIKGRKRGPIKNACELKNPLLGILVCGNCGKPLQRHPDKKTGRPFMLCKTRGCSMVSSYVDIVEEMLIKELTERLLQLEQAEKQEEKYPDYTPDIKAVEQSLVTVSKQQERLYDLLEQGIYDTDVFLERNAALKKRIQALNDNLEELKNKMNKRKTAANMSDEIERISYVIQYYFLSDDMELRNGLLKSVIRNIKYYKHKRGQKSDITGDLRLEIELKNDF